MSWKVHETDEVFAALRGLCSNSYRMYDPSEYRYYYDHECDAYECVVEDAAEEYERLLRHCNHQREQLARYEKGGRTMNERTTNDERTSGAGITDELREWTHARFVGLLSSEWGREVDGIADRIDKEHAEAVADALQLRGEPDRWVELPADADGVPIHVGDVMEWPDGSTFDVVGISATTLFYVEHDFDDSAQWTAAHDKRHVKPDSWQRIIEDAYHYGIAHPQGYVGDDIIELVERCKRLAGETE